MNFCKYVPSLWLSFLGLPVCNGVKSVVIKYFEPMALFLEARFRLFCLRYDIVKAHGGELTVETIEARPTDPVGRGEGSTFFIQLPNHSSQ